MSETPKTKSQKGRVASKEKVRTYGQQRLTPKQAKFVQGIAEGKSGTQAALEAYNTDDPNVAHVIASENLQKPTIRQAYDAAMRKLNITPERVLAPIDRALSFQGDTERETLEMQLKGTDRALKLMSLSDDENKGTIVNFNFGLKSDGE